MTSNQGMWLWRYLVLYLGMSSQITPAEVWIYYSVLLREGSVQITKMKSILWHGLLLQILLLVEVVLYHFPSSLSPYAPLSSWWPPFLWLSCYTPISVSVCMCMPKNINTTCWACFCCLLFVCIQFQGWPPCIGQPIRGPLHKSLHELWCRCIHCGWIPHDLLVSVLCPAVFFHDGLHLLQREASLMMGWELHLPMGVMIGFKR